VIMWQKIFWTGNNITLLQ